MDNKEKYIDYVKNSGDDGEFLFLNNADGIELMRYKGKYLHGSDVTIELPDFVNRIDREFLSKTEFNTLVLKSNREMAAPSIVIADVAVSESFTIDIDLRDPQPDEGTLRYRNITLRNIACNAMFLSAAKKNTSTLCLHFLDCSINELYIIQDSDMAEYGDLTFSGSGIMDVKFVKNAMRGELSQKNKVVSVGNLIYPESGSNKLCKRLKSMQINRSLITQSTKEIREN